LRRGEDEPTSPRPFSDLVVSEAEARPARRAVPTPADDTTPPMGIIVPATARPVPKLRALVIEGDKAFAEQLRSELELRGYLVEVELDPSAAMSRVETEQPHVIILCAELGGSSGFPICNRLKRDERWKTTPLVLTSARETARTWRQHEKLPTRADAYLCKPFTTDELIAAISALTRPGPGPRPGQSKGRPGEGRP
jgi:CheY-like chemotaxis protein